MVAAQKERRPNRSPEEVVAELESKIAAVRARAERKKINANPAIKLAKQAARLLEKAVTVADDAELRKALQDAALTAHGCVGIEGGMLKVQLNEQIAMKPESPAAPGRSRRTRTDTSAS